MRNRLPEKLALLRKHYGYSQSDISEKLDIPVTEYMNWENGNSICNIEQLKQLAALFRVPLDAMADNSKTIVLAKKKEETGTIDIPPFKPEQPENIEETKAHEFVIPDERPEVPVTDKTHSGALETAEEMEQTKVVDTQQFQRTVSNEIVDELPESAVQEEYYEEPEEDGKKKSSTIFMLVAAAVVFLIAGLILLFSDRRSVTNTLSDVNRLARGDTFTLYIDKDGVLRSAGNADTSGFTDVVQVDAYENRAAGLKKNGTVVTSYADAEAASWKDIIMIAVGREHTVGLKKDGTVVCSGPANACQVEGWTGIQSVYAGDNLTVGLDSAGSLKASGTGAGEIEKVTAVRDLALGKDLMIVIENTGKAKAYSLNGGEVPDVSGWQSVEKVAVGDEIAVALMKNGMTAAVSENTALKKIVLSWSDIRFIDVCGDKVAAADRSGDVHLSEDDMSRTQPEDEDTPTDKLSSVTGVTFSETTANVVVKWSPVPNAGYYEVSIDTDPVTEFHNIGTTSTSIPASALTTGHEYMVTITAFPDNPKQYLSSDPTQIRYQYVAKTIPLGMVGNIATESTKDYWKITWNSVDHADFYWLSIDGAAEIQVEGTSYTVDMQNFEYFNGSTHNIQIAADSFDQKYSKGEPVRTALKYEFKITDFVVILEFVDNATNETLKTAELELEEGTYYLSSYVPEGYELLNPDADAFVVESDLQKQVIVRAIAEPEPEEPVEEPGEENG